MKNNAPSTTESKGYLADARSQVNFANRKYYATDLTYALLSAHVYSDIKIGEVVFAESSKNKKYNDSLKDWQVHKVFDMKECGGYYAALYENNKDHQFVLAHRGTIAKLEDILKLDSSIKTDIVGIFYKQTVAQQDAAYIATKNSIDIAKEMHVAKGMHYTFSTTGHSLGGWLAELSIYFCKNDFSYKGKAVTFDSPGSVVHMEKGASNIISHRTSSDIRNLEITTYLSAPNFVNSCNKHCGKVYRLYPEIKNPVSVEKTLDFVKKIPLLGNKVKENGYFLNGLFSILGHSLDGLIEKFDPETGKPEKYDRVLDWPVIERTIANNQQPGSISKLVPNNTLFAVVNIINDLFQGKIDTNQYFKTHEYLPDGKGENIKQEEKVVLVNNKEYSLTYEGHYKIVQVDLHKDVLNSFAKGGVDWCLKRLWQYNEAMIKTSFSKATAEQLLTLKNLYDAYTECGRNMISTKVEGNKENISVDDVREMMQRLIDADNEIRKDLGKNPFVVISSNRAPKKVCSSFINEKDPYFVERDKYTTKLDSIWGKYQLAIVTGLPGVGKSSCVSEYTRNLDKEGYKIITFCADSKTQIYQEYVNLAQEFQIDISVIKTDKTLVKLVNQKLVEQKLSVILVFDNVDDWKDVKDYLINLPQNIKILITSRDINLSTEIKKAQYIQISPFSMDESVKYLSDKLEDKVSSGNITEQDLTKLIKEIGNAEGCLPYKLKQVASLLVDKRFTIEKCIQLHKQGDQDDVETALLLDLLKTSPKSWELMQYSTYLNPNFINLEILYEVMLIDHNEIMKCVNLLEKLSLVDSVYQKDGSGLKIHRLTQDSIKKYLDRHSEQQTEQQIIPKHEIITNLTNALNDLMPSVASNPDERWSSAGKFFNNVDKILQEVKDSKLPPTLEQTVLYSKLGNYDNFIGFNHQQALEHLKQALVMWKETLGDKHPDVATSLNNVGGTYGKLGDHQQALEYHEQALAMWKETLGDKHPSVAASLNNVGYTYGALGDHQQALEYHKQALAMMKEILGDKHPSVATSLNNVGYTYGALGDHQQALEYLKQGLAMRKEILGDKHPSVAQSLNNVGYTYGALGDHQQALEYHEQALAMRKEILGDKHPSVANSLNNVGYTYGQIGDHQQALEYQKQALAMSKEILGDKHPNVANSLNNVGYTYGQIGDHQQALEYQKQGLAMMKEILGDKHPSVATSLNNVGGTYGKLGDHQQALEYQKQGLAMRKEILGDKHPSVANSLHNVGGTYGKLGDHQQALEYHEQALAMWKETLGDKHPSVAASLNNVGGTYGALGGSPASTRVPKAGFGNEEGDTWRQTSICC